MATTRTILATVTPNGEVALTPRSIAAILTSLGENLSSSGPHGPTCLWYGIQNKDASNSCYVQSSNAASGNDNVEILAGAYRQFPPCNVKYDLEEEFLRVGADNQIVSIEVMWG